MSLIDRVSRAMVAQQGNGDTWDALDAVQHNQVRSNLRTILKALRDPDQRMTEAGAEIVRNVGPSESHEAYMSDAANTWRYMIDALLEEDS